MSTNAEDKVEVRVLLARFETKLDVVIGQHGEQLKDHEGRLRVVESRKTVSPMGLLGALASVLAVVGGSVAILDRLYL